MHNVKRGLREHMLESVREGLGKYPFRWTEPDAGRIGRPRSPLGRKLFIDVLPVADVHRSWGEVAWSPQMAMQPESSFFEFTLEARKVERAHWLYEQRWWHILAVVWPVERPLSESAAQTLEQVWVHNPLGWNRGMEIEQVGETSPALRFKMGSPGWVEKGAGLHPPGFEGDRVKWEYQGRWDGWSYKRPGGLWQSVCGSVGGVRPPS